MAKITERTPIIHFSTLPEESTGSSSLTVPTPAESSLETLLPPPTRITRFINWISDLFNKFLILFRGTSEKNKNALLATAITQATRLEDATHFPTLSQAKLWIENGADLGTMAIDHALRNSRSNEYPLFTIIVNWSHCDEWKELLTLAIQKASQSQIRTALENTIKTLLSEEQPHLIQAAKELIAAGTKFPSKEIIIAIPLTIIDENDKCSEITETQICDALEDWDRKKGWGLFP